MSIKYNHYYNNKDTQIQSFNDCLIRKYQIKKKKKEKCLLSPGECVNSERKTTLNYYYYFG